MDSTLVVNETADVQFNREFFEGFHLQNPQPKTFLHLQNQGANHSLTLHARAQLDDFYETTERLPDARFQSFRQQIGSSPLYYESDSSAALLRRSFAEGDPAQDYEAFRADTFHQLVAPRAWFGWLNVTPRVGGRYTHYGEASGPGGLTEAQDRWVFNTGVELSTKLSRVWPGARSAWLNVNGLRHIIIPSINYAYTPNPNVDPDEIPQFDRALPSLRLLPLTFPEFNAD